MPTIFDVYKMPVHQDQNPLNVEETIKIQAKISYKDHLIFKVLGVAMLAGLIAIPYYSAPYFLDQGAALFTSKPSLLLVLITARPS